MTTLPDLRSTAVHGDQSRGLIPLGTESFGGLILQPQKLRFQTPNPQPQSNSERRQRRWMFWRKEIAFQYCTRPHTAKHPGASVYPERKMHGTEDIEFIMPQYNPFDPLQVAAFNECSRGAIIWSGILLWILRAQRRFASHVTHHGHVELLNFLETCRIPIHSLFRLTE